MICRLTPKGLALDCRSCACASDQGIRGGSGNGGRAGARRAAAVRARRHAGRVQRLVQARQRRLGRDAAARRSGPEPRAPRDRKPDRLDRRVDSPGIDDGACGGASLGRARRRRRCRPRRRPRPHGRRRIGHPRSGAVHATLDPSAEPQPRRAREPLRLDRRRNADAPAGPDRSGRVAAGPHGRRSGPGRRRPRARARIRPPGRTRPG